MTIELYCLLAIAALLLGLAGMSGAVYGHQAGVSALLGNRGHETPNGIAGRTARAHLNLLENAVPFAIVVLIATMAGLSTEATRAAALVFVAARLVHATTYILGIPVLRTAAWAAGVGATLIMAVVLI